MIQSPLGVLEGSFFQFIHICHLIKTETWISWILPSFVGADGHRIFVENPSSQNCTGTGTLSHIQRHKLPSSPAALEPARFSCAQRTMFSPDSSAALRPLVRANPMCCTAHPKTNIFENPSSATTQRNKRASTELEPKSAKTSDIKEMLGKSIRIVENTQNAPIDSINENRWNTLMPLQPV